MLLTKLIKINKDINVQLGIKIPEEHYGICDEIYYQKSSNTFDEMMTMKIVK